MRGSSQCAAGSEIPGERDAGTASDAVTYTPIATMLPRRERATLAVQRDAGVTRKGG